MSSNVSLESLIDAALGRVIEASGQDVCTREHAQAKAVIRTFASHSSNESPDSNGEFEYIKLRMASEKLDGTSTKLANFSFDLMPLLETVSKLVFTGVSVSKVPWLAPFGLLVAWKEIKGLTTVAIDRHASMVLLAIHLCNQAGDPPSTEAITQKAASVFTRYQEALPSANQIDKALATLAALGCIQCSGVDHWEIIERLTI
jgi:hypothetical protein